MMIPGLDQGEVVLENMLARYLLNPGGKASPHSEGRLIVTDRRLLFTGEIPLTNEGALRFANLSGLRHERRGMAFHVLIVETAGMRFDFWTNKGECKAVEGHYRSWVKKNRLNSP
jgi:hypothetical protein